MKTCSITEAKSRLGKLADAALQGNPTIISRGGKLVILQAYKADAPIRSRPPGYFAFSAASISAHDGARP